MEFRILGPLEVARGGRPVAVEGRRRRALLAMLLVNAGQVVSQDRLIEDLWEGHPPDGAASTLRSHLSRLRQLLAAAPPAPPGPGGGGGDSGRDGAEGDGAGATAVLVGRRPGYVLELGGAFLDSARFQELVERGRTALAGGDAAMASGTLAEALALWRGPALAEFAASAWAGPEIARLEELRLTACEERVDADLALGRHAELVGGLEAAVAANPLRERMWGQLILCLYRTGRQAEALRAYQSLRQRLADELGIDPSPALRRLEEAVLLQDSGLDLGTSTTAVPAPRPGPVAPAPPQPPPPPDAGPRHNLPVQLTSFVGREWEVGEVRKLVESERLVTLTGAGGCGKTRLSLRVAGELVDRFGDGAWFADLSPLVHPDLVAHAVAGAVGVREVPGQPVDRSLLAHLEGKDLLLVVDNCEHVVAACAELVERLLVHCPHLTVLATSREALRIGGEVAWRVPSLSLPHAALAAGEALLEFESVRLFVERARSARADVVLGGDELAVVGRICRRLDGIPLAIELAAARIATLTVAEIEERLDDRFRLLTEGRRTALPRQQTLRAAVEWGYDLLDHAERVLLQRLSVFAGSFSPEAAEAVCAGGGLDGDDVLEHLWDLVAKSLVVMDGDAAGQTRYRLLETIRDYAGERLDEAGERAELRTRHRDWYLGVAEAAESPAMAVGGGGVLDALEADHDNFRTALKWSVAGLGGDLGGLRLAHALYPLWEVRTHYREGSRWMQALLGSAAAAHDPEVLVMRSAVARRAGNLAWEMGEEAKARELYDRALDLAGAGGDRRHLGRALMAVALITGARGDLTTSRAMLEDARVTAEEVDDEAFLAQLVLFLGEVAHRQSRYSDARVLAAECMERGAAMWSVVARARYLLAAVEREQGNYPAARQRLAECGAGDASMGDQGRRAMVLTELGAVAGAEGDLATAATLQEQAVGLARQTRRGEALAPALAALGELAARAGNGERATALLVEAVAQARHLNDAFVIAGVLNRVGAAGVTGPDGGWPRAAFDEALAVARASGMPWHAAAALEGLAAVDAAAGEVRRAVERLAAAAAVRDAIAAPLPPVDRPAHEQLLAAAGAQLTGEDRAAAEAAGTADGLALVAAGDVKMSHG